jgi:anti-sigma regulatory factor (Ser/Thr protein kinase)
MAKEPNSENLAVEEAVLLSLPAAHRYLNVLHAAISALLEHADEPVDQQKLSHIRLAVQETCANIVNHAYGESRPGCTIDVAVAIARDPLTVIVETLDTGSDFDPVAIPVPRIGVVQEGGYGIFLTRRAVDHVIYRTAAGRTWQSIANGPWEATSCVEITSLLFPGLPPKANLWRLVKRL